MAARDPVDPRPVRSRYSRWGAVVAIAAIAALAGARAARARPANGGALDGGVTGVSAVIVKGPYLQALGANGVTIKVELSAPASAKVEVLLAGGASVATRESAEARAFHALRVEGLTPATAYEYRVTAGGTTAETGHFTTAPADGRPFRFLAYGDSRSDPEAHAAVVRAMASSPSDFLVNTGNMVSMGNNPVDWAELFSIEGRMLRDRCVFAAVGNHELARGDKAGEVAFLHYFAEAEEGRELERLYGSFRWSNTRFFVLNAMDRWTGAERDWLRAELDRALTEPGLSHRFAVMHWGPFSSGAHGNNPALASGEVVAMMRDRKVDLILAGHDHIYERGAGGGLRYLITGGAGAPLYEENKHAPETLHFEAAHHFVEVAVDGDCVRTTARRPGGDVIETCGFQGDGAWDCNPPPKASAPDAGLAPSAAAGARPSCGCAVPGPPGEGWSAAALALAAVIARRRRLR